MSDDLRSGPGPAAGCADGWVWVFDEPVEPDWAVPAGADPAEPWLNRVAPESRAAAAEVLRRADGRPRTVFLALDGERVTVHLTARQVDYAGRPLLIVTAAPAADAAAPADPLEVQTELACERVRGAVLGMVTEADWPTVVETFSREAHALIDFAVCSINLVDRADEQVHSYSFSDDAGFYTRVRDWIHPVLDEALATGRPVVRRGRDDPRWDDAHGELVQAVIDVPFLGGTLALNSPRPDSFGPRDVGILQRFAAVFSSAQQRLADLTNLSRRTAELEAENAERRQVEARQAALLGNLRAVLSAADLLIATPDEVTLQRRAVELAREMLGLDRVALYLLDDEGRQLHGTFGTDAGQRTTDERSSAMATPMEWRELLTFRGSDQPRWRIVPKASLYDDQIVGRGDQGMAVVQSGERTIGVLFSDNLTSGRPLEPATQEVLALYGSLLGNILERRRAEETLRLSLQTSDDIVRAIPAGLFIYQFEPPDRLVLVSGNPAAERLAEVRVADEMGREFNDIWPAARESGLTASLLTVATNGRPYETEEYQYADGRLAGAFRIRAFALPGRRVAVTFENTTEQRRAAVALQHSHDLLRYIIEHANSAVAVHDRDLRYIYVSQRYLDAYGVVDRDIIGKHHYEVFPDLPEKWREVHRRVLAGEVHGSELDPYHHDGETDYTRWQCRPWFAADGSIGGLIVYTEIITERVRSEQALRESEALLQATIEASPLAFVCLDLDGVVVRWNQAAERIFGWTEQEVLGRQGALIGDDPVDEALAIWDRVIGGEAVSGIELVRRRKGGELIDISLSTAAIRDGEGRIQAVLGVVQDISERKRSEAERESLQSQLIQAQKMEAVGQLAGGIAHDFNNMLSVILGHTELALGELEADSTLAADLREIQRAALRSADLTRQLLAFARRQTVAPRVLDLNATVEGMLSMLRRLIGEQVELDWRPGDELRAVRVDPAQIDQILANLLVNARDAIGGVGRVGIETRNLDADEALCGAIPDLVPGPYVLLRVSDTGSGMDPDTLRRLFEPFFTTKEVGRGTGLGLATVYGIVRQNGGAIEVQSSVGEGSSFSVYLPAEAGAAAVAAPTVAGDDAPRGRGETILLVEDDPAVLRLGQRMLGQMGYRVLAAGSPRQALALAAAHAAELDLLVTDVIMPEMNGRDLAARIADLAPGLRCLYTSGYTADVIAGHGVLDDGVEFLQKPFDVEGLAAKVRALLSSSTRG